MFEVGQKVWDVTGDEGVVCCIHKDHPYPVVVKFGNGNERTYNTDGKSVKINKNPSLYPYPVEIVKKITKPSINWEHVRIEYKFLAQDADGRAYLFIEKPESDGNYWMTSEGKWSSANSHVSYTPGTCDWKDSLVARQEGV